MAATSSKVTRILGLLRHEIHKYTSSGFSGEITSFPSTIAQGSSRILQSNPLTLGSSVFAGTCSKQLGNVNLPGRVGPFCYQKVTLQLARAAYKFSEQGRKMLATRGFISGSRSAEARGLQRTRVTQRIDHGSATSVRILKTPSVRHEVNSMKGRGDIRGWRTYYVDRRGMEHFKRRGPASWTEKLASQHSATTIIILAGGMVIVYVTHIETVPYSHRKHFVLVSPELERALGDSSFEMILQEYKSRVLPPNHPESLRVYRIANQIIAALMRGVKASDWGHVEKGGEVDFSKEWDRSMKKSERPILEPYSDHTHSDDESLDDNWVDKSRKEALGGEERFTKHLEGMKWKVIVVDDDIVNAICIPGGKIVVFTGLLKKFRSDAEIATVLAHEVGHAVARHSAESLTRGLFIVAVQLLVLSVFYVPGLVNSLSELLLRLPFSRRVFFPRYLQHLSSLSPMFFPTGKISPLFVCKSVDSVNRQHAALNKTVYYTTVTNLTAQAPARMETEADHIGLMLMAAAGYDPRLAPAFYEKLGKLEKSPEYAQYLSTHPSGKARGQKLRETNTMNEAVLLYQQKMLGQGTEGFF